MASRRRQRRHRAKATGRATVYGGTARRSRYAKPAPSGRKLGSAKAAAGKGLGRAVAAADTASSLHGGILAVGAGIAAARAGHKYVQRRKRKRAGPQRDSKGRFT